MRYETQTVFLSEIDRADQAFRLGFDRESERLVESMKTHGLINPPVLRKRSDGYYTIVCGFQRVGAAEALGWSQIPARVITEAVSDGRLIELAVSDNRSHRDLNVIEQAQGVRKLTALRRNMDLGTLSSLLGFPANEKVFRKIKAVAALPAGVQEGLLRGSISFEAAVVLTTLSPDEITALFDLLQALKLSQNKEKEVIDMVREIAEREEIAISDVIEGSEIEDVIRKNDLNRNEKGKYIREYLKKRRFPNLVKAEKEFHEAVRGLKLPKSFRINPPANFEGPFYSLCMTFRDLKELEQCHEDLKGLLDHPGIKGLFGPQEGE